MRKMCWKFLVGLCLSVVLVSYGGWGSMTLGSVTLAQAAIINVPLEYSTIQSAIDDANSGDTVLVDDGVYTENINFLGKIITVQSVNGADYTTIDGNASGSVVTFSSGEGADSVLDGFTIQNGSAYYGGGIYCDNYSSPTITNCTISNNSASGRGGGIYCNNYSSPTLTNCAINNNTAGPGGGIYCDRYSSPTITNCTINGNTAMGTYGGGIFCNYSSPTVTNCTISSNSASYGGGIFCQYSSSPTISNCIIISNSAMGTYARGGGIYCSGGSPTITNCTISANSASYVGGGIYFDHSPSPTITNCTISSNTANHYGGGILCPNYSSATVVNSILWGDTAGISGNEISLGVSSSITVDYSDIQGGYAGTGNIDADPLFVGSGDYHLTASSPCIDTGTDDTVTYPTLPSDDIDGDARPQDGDGDGTAQYDMGSDEYVAEEAAGSISGFVTETSYFPIAYARVNLIQGGTLLDFTFTDSYGHYEFANLADGVYRVIAGKSGYSRDMKLGKVQQATPWGKEEFINFILIP